jgi:hypothetical protein
LSQSRTLAKRAAVSWQQHSTSNRSNKSLKILRTRMRNITMRKAKSKHLRIMVETREGRGRIHWYLMLA